MYRGFHGLGNQRHNFIAFVNGHTTLLNTKLKLIEDQLALKHVCLACGKDQAGKFQNIPIKQHLIVRLGRRLENIRLKRRELISFEARIIKGNKLAFVSDITILKGKSKKNRNKILKS